MRLGRIGLGLATALMGLSNACSQAVKEYRAFSSSIGNWSPVNWTQPPRYKSKPNKVSQAKRRKYVRQGRG